MSNVHPIFAEMMKPFLSTGLTTEQRITIADEINVITKANGKILEIISEMDDQKRALRLIKSAETISEGATQLFTYIR